MGQGPKPPRLPPPPPAPADLTDQAVRDVAAAERRKTLAKGRRSTFLTGGAGLTTPPSTLGKP